MQRNAEDILPIDVWGLIVGQFGAASPFHFRAGDPFLLILACVCRVLNQLSMRRYLLGADVSAKAQDSGNVFIDASYLPALRMACCAPAIAHLYCDGFAGGSCIRSALNCVRDLAKRSPVLRGINLRFPNNLLVDCHSAGGLAGLCDLMHVMSLKVAGPVIFLSEAALFRCTADDISHWNLSDGTERSLFPGRTRRIPGYCIVRDHLARRIKLHLLPALDELTVSSLTSVSDAFESCTLMIFNPHRADFLRLGRPAVPNTSNFSLSSADVSAILPHISLPFLRRLEITTATIAPTALTQLFRQHPGIQLLVYGPKTTVTNPRPSLILSTPLAHPGLTGISVSDPADLIPVLNSVGSSPALSEIAFPFTHRSPALTAALQRLAAHPLPTTLTLRLCSGYATLGLAPASADAQALHCVTQVHVDCTSIPDAQALLPWLALLPTARRVDFRSAPGIFRRDTTGEPQGPTMRFLAAAIATLPGVEVVVREAD